ncbi:uncharacterized protein EV422DRAFT_67014 [Fimicolochytrium jonesii]|uniref:uncharacterized protein n=1 Tax=Fimicolochytrium jonesii TaxID=1396493 RepID=UPI0022FECD33|nr:uncharacterized protein EV422DRAFT_67014 [Fimicolochytrium jonesii]KAI8820880.1 hypothetical protein EV422DRAFT_67014 [Fimicolochytrium jonesii]
MKVLAVCEALYDYEPQSDEELALVEGDLLLIIEKDDADWWMAVQRPKDTFADVKTGLVPASYVKEAEPLTVGTALYNYEAATSEELTFPEDVQIQIFENTDIDWWFGRYEDQVGLVPATYIEVAETNGAAVNGAGTHADHAPSPAHAALPSPVKETPQSHPGGGVEDAEAQKKQLLSALGGFGFDRPKAAPRHTSIENLGPEDINYYAVTEVDKKKKKNSRKGLMGISDEFVLYFISDLKSKTLLSKWEMSQISKFSEKKSKKLILEISGEEHQFEGEKQDVLALLSRLQTLENKRQTGGSGPHHDAPPRSANRTSMPPPSATPPANITSTPSPVRTTTAAPLPVVPVASPAHVSTPQHGQGESRKIAIALYEYEATNEEELTIKENDNLLVLDDSDEEWWFVRLISKKGREGLVPASYVELKRPNVDGGAAPGPAQMLEDEAQKERQRRQAQEEAKIQMRMRQQEEEKRFRDQQEKQLRQQEEARKEEEKAKREEEARRQREEQTRKQEPPAQPPRPPAIPERLPGVPEPPARPTPAIPSNRPTDTNPATSAPQLFPRPTPSAASVTAPAPVLPARPPPIQGRTSGFPKPSQSEGAGKVPAASKPDTQDKPDPKKLRWWTDRSGTFKVEAEYIGVGNGEVQLHKTNGVKIGVPLSKLDPKDVEIIRRMPGNEHLQVPNGPAAHPSGPRGAGPSVATLAAAASVPVPSAASATCIYNGFDWKEFLISAGVSPGDAVIYGQKFVGEKMDRTHLPDLERELLRNLGVSEGDILRIRKASSGQGKPMGAANEKENAALQNNLMFLNKQQTGGSDGGRPGIPRRSSKPNAPGPNLHSIQQAADLLKASSTGPGSRHMSPQPSPPGTPHGRGSFSNLAGASSKAHDPWAISHPASGLNKPPVTSGVAQPQPTNNNAAAAIANVNNAANQQAILLARKQQAETQAALQQAQQALLKAQEQARQTAQVQAQAALMKAQETARQAALVQQQAEQALLTAQQSAAARAQQQMQPPQLGMPSMMPPLTSFAAAPQPQPVMAPPRPAALPPPLIPATTNLGNAPGFIPVGGGNVRPQQPNVPFQQGLGGFQGGAVNPQGGGDRYSVFKELDPMAPSMFTNPQQLNQQQQNLSRSNPALAQQNTFTNAPTPNMSTGLPSPALSFTGSTSSANSAFSNQQQNRNSAFGGVGGIPQQQQGGGAGFLQGVARGPQQGFGGAPQQQQQFGQQQPPQQQFGQQQPMMGGFNNTTPGFGNTPMGMGMGMGMGMPGQMGFNNTGGGMGGMGGMGGGMNMGGGINPQQGQMGMQPGMQPGMQGQQQGMMGNMGMGGMGMGMGNNQMYR